MKLEEGDRLHLTYCSNIHPGRNWEEHFSELRNSLPVVRGEICGDAPFGLGLRISAAAAEELLRQRELDRFRTWMEEGNYYLFTINGFPYGDFHGVRVKEQVYAPDWRSRKRVEYTDNLITLLAELLPEGVDGGISTSPVSYKGWFPSASDESAEALLAASRHFSELARRMAALEAETGRELHLDIEPEPDCLLENGSETVDFFTKRLLPAGTEHLAARYGVSSVEAERWLLRHIRVCYDTCHFAVQFEEPAAAIRRFADAGIGIGKVQISSALRVRFDSGPGGRENLRQLLESFDEPVYLHQVRERRKGGEYRTFADLPDALRNLSDPDAIEWRIHFHVPIFLDSFGLLKSTSGEILPALEALAVQSGCRHFEVETYTWEVLPEEMRGDLNESIVRELEWARSALLRARSSTGNEPH